MKSYLIDNLSLFEYNGKASQPKIPNKIISIEDSAFSDCETITSLKIPNCVTFIGPYAFARCYNLTSIEIPNSVDTICNFAFVKCISLSNIKIPSSVTYIGYNAFDEIKQVKTQYNANGSLRAFKGFKQDWTCRDFKYKVGESYHKDGKIQCCYKGFHACTNPLNVFNYYYGDLRHLHFAEVELSGKMDREDDKVAASDIRIVRELSLTELVEIYHSMEKV